MSIRIISLFMASFIFFIWGVSGQEVIGFESRFYLFALEMWRHGVSWFPMTYLKPYPDYPALSTFLIYLTAKLLGGMSKLAAVIPTALAASVTVVMTYLIGLKQDRRTAWFAVLFTVLTVTFFKSARSLALDMYPAMITAICFYLVLNGRPKSVFIWLLLGFAFRGPIGLVMPTGVICIYYLLEKNLKKCLTVGLLALILLMISMGALLALAHHVGGQVFMQDVLRMQMAGRIENHHLPLYFYFTNSLASYALSYPVAILMLAGCLYTAIKHQKTMLTTYHLQLIGWVLVILIGMSIPGEKKVRYVLPMVPALALLSASLLALPWQNLYLQMLRRGLIRFMTFLPLLLALGVEIVFYHAKFNSTPIVIHYIMIFALLIGLQCVNLLYFYREKIILSVSALCFMATYIMVVEPVALYAERARDLVVAVEIQRMERQAELIFYREKPDGLPIKYLINTPAEVTPLFFEDESEILKFNAPAVYVTTAKQFSQLSPRVLGEVNIIASDSLGHVSVVAFIKRDKS